MLTIIHYLKPLCVSLILVSCILSAGLGTAYAQATEICANGLDDDGDNLIDCQDPDCPECARMADCRMPNVCYMPPIWAVPSTPGSTVYGSHDLVLSTSAAVNTVTIQTPDGSFTRTVVVTSSGSTIVSLPLSVVQSNTLNAAQRNKGLIITSDEPVQVTYRQTASNNQDIIPLKCGASLGYSFYAGSQTRLTATNVTTERHFVSVMATQPNTVVTFRSPIAFDGASSFPLTVTLQAGDTYMLASRLINAGANSANESVSGVLVTSTQPIVVNSGSQHTAQPFSGNRDAGMDQLIPIRTTGTDYVAVHGPSTSNNADYVVVIASENNTTVTISGPATVGGASGVRSTTTLNAGQVYTYNLPNVPNRAFTVNTSKRSYTYHVSSYSSNEYGMGILPNINPCNGSKRIDFYRTSGSSLDQAIVTIPTTGLSSLTFRGAPYTTYGSVIDNVTVNGIAHSIVSFPNGSIAAAGTVNTISSSERFHVGVVSNTGGGATGNFGYYSNYEAKVDVLNPTTRLPADFYSVGEVTAGVSTPHCLTLTSCGTNDRITGIVNGTYTQGTSFSGVCLNYTMLANAPKCARDTIRVQVENNLGRQNTVCLEFINRDNNLIATVIPSNPVVCQPGGSTSLTVIAQQTTPASGITYRYQVITPDKQLLSTSVVSGTATGQYRITVIDSNGCRDTTSVYARSETPAISFGSGPVTACAGSAVTYSLAGTTGTYSWSVTGGTIQSGGTSGSNSATILWTTTGSVRATVTTPNGCTAAVTQAVTVSPSPTLTATTRNPLCNGASTGAINLTVTGGTSPYSFSWSNGTTTEDLANIRAGNYSVSVTDRNGCAAAAALSVTLTEPTPLTATQTVANVSCSGGSNGAISLSATGGIGPYRYVWNTGATTADLSNLAAGVYTVTIQDANSCSQAVSVTVSQPAALTLLTTRQQVSCAGQATGGISLTATGGTSPRTYLWNTGATATSLGSLTAGAYSVTVTDANSCSATTSVVLTQPAAISLIGTAANPHCNGEPSGSINLTPTGGTPNGSGNPYTYQWSNGFTTEDISAVVAGTYSVTVTDANGCSRTLATQLTQPPALVPSVSSQTPSCFNGSNGSISVSGTGGTSPYSARWNDGHTTLTRTGLPSGLYSVTLTDASGCAAVTSLSLSQPAALSAGTTLTNVACNGRSTGAIDLSVSGGTSPYSYNWSTGAVTQDVSSLSASSYSVIITDGNGCQLSVGATISEPRLLVLAATPVNILCPGGPGGSIATDVRGGITPYSYLWSNGSTGATVDGLPAGSYSLVVTDANACTAMLTTTINVPPPFGINASVRPVACNSGNDGSVNLTVSGGTSFTTGTPYRYLWSNGATTEDVSGLTAGTYSVTITDASNCHEFLSLSVMEPPVFTVVESHTNISCHAASTGAITLTVTGGVTPYSYVWNDGATSLNRVGLAAGTYTLVITDQNSCTAGQTVSLTQSAALGVAQSATSVACFGGANGAIGLTGSGGTAPLSYLWNTGATTSGLSSLTAGVYSATITDANACSLAVQHLLTQPPALTATLTQQAIRCYGAAAGQASMLVTGGTAPYTYRWNDGNTSQDRAGLLAGTYSVTALDANACSQSLNLTIAQPTALSLTLSSSHVTCAGGTTGAISVSVTGATAPYSYNWSDGSTAQHRTDLPAGTYTITVLDANSCGSTQTVSLTQSPALAVTTSLTNVGCFGANTGALTVSVSGGSGPYSYTWSDGGSAIPNRTGLPTGTYVAQIADGAGCRITASASLTQPAVLNLNGSTTAVTCAGSSNGAAALILTGGTPPYSAVWNDGNTSQNRTGLTTGVYSVTVSDARQCSQTVSLTVSQPTPISLTVLGTATRCNGGSDGAADLTVSGGTAPYRYTWSNNATTEDLSAVVAGTYAITVLDATNCQAVGTVSIGQPDALAMALTARHNLCAGESKGELTANITGGTGPYTYAWSNATTDPTAVSLLTGSYSVSVTDANGCILTGSSAITAAPALTTAKSTTDVGCFGRANGALSLTITGGTPAYSFAWSDGNTTDQNRTNLTAGTYNVTISDQNGCQTAEFITIGQPTALSLTASATAATCSGTATGSLSPSVSGGVAPYAYRWSQGATTAQVTSVTAGVYSLTVTDSNQCAATASATVGAATCVAPCSVSAVVSSVSCNSLTNQYTLTGSVSFTNTGATITLADGAATTVLSATGVSPMAFTLTGSSLVSNGSNHTLTATASASGCVSTTTYAAPASCTVALAALGNFVFEDVNRNGIQDTGDLPIAGAMVTLLQNGTAVATTVTSASGLYSFTSLMPGIPYSISFTVSSGFLTSTSANVGSNDAIDSDVVNGLTAPYTLTAGETNTSADAGFVRALVGPGPLVLLTPKYNCATGVISFSTTGGNGSPIEFSGIGITGWTTATSFTLDAGLRNDPKTLVIYARQNGVVVSVSFDMVAACTDCTPGPGKPLQIQTPILDCYTSSVTITTCGGEGTPILYRIVDVVDWSAYNLVMLGDDLVHRDPKVVFIQVQQTNGEVVTLEYNLPEASAQCPVDSRPWNTTSPTAPPPPSTTVTVPGTPTANTGLSLSLIEPLYNCTAGVITFRHAGGNGTPVEYMAVGVTGWTTQPINHVDEGVRIDQPTLTLMARQSGVTVSRSFTIRAYCSSPPSSTTSSPPSNTTSSPPSSTTATPTQPTALSLIMPTINCATGAIMFRTLGGNGSPIEFMAIGITGWTTNPNQTIDAGLRTAADAQPLTLMARQSGIVATYVFNLRAACPIGARIAAPDHPLELSVLGNPTTDNEATVLVKGAISGTKLTVVNSEGRIMGSYRADGPPTGVVIRVRLGSSPGVYSIRAMNETQAATVKVVKE